MEASTYLSDGHGRRLAIEARPTGWNRIGEMARVWQPSRLKGITVPEETGAPFLSAGQVFEAQPQARKWLSLQKTPDAEDRFVDHGLILLSCSGTVGRVTMAHHPHDDHIITHDLLRIEPKVDGLQGWIYAFMRTTDFRAMATGAHYGHMIKHLEPAHVGALPIPSLDDRLLHEFEVAFRDVLDARDRAGVLRDEALELYSAAIAAPEDDTSSDEPFTIPARDLLRGRRRLDAYHHNSVVRRVSRAMSESARTVELLPDVTKDIWWPNRFKRAFGEGGAPYVSAVELFDLNPPITKHIYAGLVANAHEYFVEPGWLLMARSGQIYGLNGRVVLASERHAEFFVSEDIIRIVPDQDRIRPGYLQAVLGHPFLGRPLVLRHAYGTSIPHLEPGDLSGVAVPRYAEDVETAIADRMEECASLTSHADKLEDEMTSRAEALIEQFLHAEV